MAADDSILAHFRRVISLRHDEPVVAYGDFTMLIPEHEQLYVFTRSLDGIALLVVGNFSSEPVGLDAVPGVDDWLTTDLVLGNYPDPGETPATLRPWEARVYRRSVG
jgi:oligo-1,6-glucosidase